MTYSERKARDGATVMLAAEVLICQARGYHHQAVPVTVPAECGDCGALLSDWPA